MSTLDPDDDALAGLFSQLDGIPEPKGVVDFTKLSEVELSDRFNQVRDRLIQMDEMHADTGLSRVESTPEGRELHSQRAALLVEMSRRNMR